MCRSMVDIPSATAENTRGKKIEDRKKAQDKNTVSVSAMQRGHNYSMGSANIYISVRYNVFTSMLFSERSLFAVARPSVVCLSVTLVRPTQAVEIFGNISTALGALAIHGKFHGDRPRGILPPGS